MTTPSEFIGRPHDFDFLVGGTWHVADRRLLQRLRGGGDWATFEHTCRAVAMMDGQISTDENVFASLGFTGVTFRTLDVASRRWAIYWINSRDGRVQPPVHGGWNGDRGEFFGDDEDDGRPVRVRFVWERLGADRARWTQDFALIAQDGGADGPWETNWVMELSRLRD
jgi:hypothetical protein